MGEVGCYTCCCTFPHVVHVSISAARNIIQHTKKVKPARLPGLRNPYLSALKVGAQAAGGEEWRVWLLEEYAHDIHQMKMEKR